MRRINLIEVILWNRGRANGLKGAVPRFYFNLQNGESIADPEGLELDGLESAKEIAIRGARDIMAADVRDGHLRLDESISITNGSERVLATITFRDALEITGEQAMGDAS